MGIGQRMETSSALGLSAIVVSEITHNHKLVSSFSTGLDLYNARAGLGSIVGLRFLRIQFLVLWAQVGSVRLSQVDRFSMRRLDQVGNANHLIM